MVSFIENHLIVVFVAAIICLILYLISNTFRAFIKGLACGILAAGAYYTLMMFSPKEADSIVAIIIFALVTLIMTYLQARQKFNEEKMAAQEQENIQRNVEALSQALDEIAENIRIIQDSPFDYTDEENLELHEAFQMFYQMRNAFEDRAAYPYVATVNFIQDVFMRVYGAAQARYATEAAKAWQRYQAEYDEENREAEERRQQRRGQSLHTSSKETLGYFSGCDTKASLKKRYRELCKIYHPDNAGGNADTFKQVQDEYKQKLASIA